MFGKKFKAQSAMEYLMTYGWAILIIAVVLGALFALGVFNSSSLIGTSCVALSGYYCANPVLSTSGALTLTVGQATGTTYSSVTAYIVPSGSTFSTADANTLVNAPAGTLNSGQTATVTINNVLPNPSSLGTVFTGQVWLVFSTPSSSNLETQIATLTVKVT